MSKKPFCQKRHIVKWIILLFLAAFLFSGCTPVTGSLEPVPPVPDTPGPVLFAPSVIRGNGKLSVSWVTESGFQYELFYGTDAGSENQNKWDDTFTENNSIVGVEIIGLDNGSAYYVLLSRKSEGGEKELSVEIKEVPEARPANAPDDFAYVPGGTVIGSVAYAISVTVPHNTAKPDDGEYMYAGQTLVKKGVFVEGRKTSLASFYMAKHEITRKLWDEVEEWGKTKGYFFQHTISAPNTPDEGNKPVTGINWRDAVVWCNAYSEKSGLAPVYYYSGNVLRDSRNSNKTACDAAVMDTSKNGFRLPAETEREYAARGGDPGKPGWMYKYAGSDTPEEVAWSHGNSPKNIQPVGTRAPNQFGIFDLSGNAQEWGWDWMHFATTVPWETPWDGAAYSSRFSQKPFSGGGVRSNVTMSCAADRWGFSTNFTDAFVGFRVVRKVE